MTTYKQDDFYVCTWSAGPTVWASSDHPNGTRVCDGPQNPHDAGKCLSAVCGMNSLPGCASSFIHGPWLLAAERTPVLLAGLLGSTLVPNTPTGDCGLGVWSSWIPVHHRPAGHLLAQLPVQGDLPTPYIVPRYCGTVCVQSRQLQGACMSANDYFCRRLTSGSRASSQLPGEHGPRKAALP